MKPILFSFSVLVLLALGLGSCDFGKGAKMETISGKSNDVVIVIGKEVWRGQVGTLLRQSLAQPQSSLPQEEPIFTLINVPPEAFVDLFKSSRNIITVKISPTFTEPKVEFTRDTWAYPQAVVNIQANSVENFKQLFEENSEKVIGYFLRAEKDRLKKTYHASHDKVVYNVLLRDFNFKLYVPTGFKVVKRDSSFAWIRYDTPLIYQSIIIYSYPYESDSTFTRSYQLAKRNEVLRKYVPGPLPGSYMTTEMELPQDFNVLNYNGNYACEMRGLWRVEHDFMGGPFVNFTYYDPNTSRLFMIEYGQFAPSVTKRQFVNQFRAMGRTFKADSSWSSGNDLISLYGL